MESSGLLRVGFGYDSHRFVEGRKLFLGGVEIPHEKGLLGHSDADVVLHAIGDALLGAASAGDLGVHFPDNDPLYKDISSRMLVLKIMELFAAGNYRVNNVDATIVCERPRLREYIDAMEEAIAGMLGVGKDRINVKATTNEGMGSIGRGEGVAAYAVATIVILR